MSDPNSPSKTDWLSVLGAPLISIFALTIFLIALLIAYVMKNETLETAMLGVAAANATTVVNFWLGSSSNSRKKDDTISAQGAVITTQANTMMQQRIDK
jgi:uncharacterized membrane protein